MSTSPRPSRAFLVAALSALLAVVAVPLSMPARATAASPSVVISQVYGGGGEGTSYRFDYIELYNRGTSAVALDGWSVQYGPQTGDIGTDDGLVTPLTGTLPAGAYLLVQGASGGSGGAALPKPAMVDPTPIAMSLTGGKVALVNTTAGLGCGSTATPCDLSQLPQIVDLVGWGSANLWEGASPAPATNTVTADFREADGAQDTDDNGQDFSGTRPAPRATPQEREGRPITARSPPARRGRARPRARRACVGIPRAPPPGRSPRRCPPPLAARSHRHESSSCGSGY